MRPTRSAPLSSCNSSTVILCVLIFSTFVFAAAPDRVTGAIGTSSMVSLGTGVAHSQVWAQRDLGPVDPSFQLHHLTFLVTPSVSQQKAIDTLLAQQQDPHSPQYHRWLTPEQYADRFGLSPNDVRAITTWLQSQGFSSISVARSANMITFSGTVAQAEITFRTQIHRDEVNGKMQFFNVSPPQIPAALSGIVTGMRGLNNFHLKPQVSRPKRNYNADNSFTGQFLGPPDIATVYNISSLNSAITNSTGESLAIIGQTDIFQADISDFRTGFGLSAITGCTLSTESPFVITACSTSNFKYVLYLPEGGTDPLTPDSISDDLPEADLDIEWSGATAPNAQVIYVNAPDDDGNGVVDSMSDAITNAIAPVVSMSYGLCELGNAENAAVGFTVFTEAEFKQANLQGMTIVNSSGDVGAVGCDPPQNNPDEVIATGGYAVDYPTSSPEVTAVGGTMIPQISPNEYTAPSQYWNATGTTGGSALEYIPEQGWNDEEEYGLVCADPSGFATYAQDLCSPFGITNWETAQDAFAFIAGGGGVSNCATINTNTGECLTGYPQPSYQASLDLNAINSSGAGKVTSTATRLVPDVALLSSPDFPGFIYCTPVGELSSTSPYDTETTSSCASGIASSVNGVVSGNQYVVSPSIAGGTSFAAPIFAGIVTLLNQYVNAAPGPEVTSSGLGNINPTLYTLAKTPANGVFHSAASTSTLAFGSNGAFCEVNTPSNQPLAMQCPSTGANAGFLGFDSSNYDPTTGYNLVSGLGSVNAYKLAQAWPNSTTPSFTLSVTATPDSTPVNTNVVWDGTLTATNGYSNTVALTCTTGAPSTCTISPSSITPASTGTPFTVTVGSATAGTYSFNIQGTDGTITQTQAVSLTVTTPGFTLSAAPSTVALTPGAAGGTSTINVADVGGFTGSVGLAASGLPSGVTAIFNPTSTSSTSTLTLTASGSATPGPATVTITGTSGSITATTSVSLTVAQNFVVSTPTPPSPSTVPSGTATTSTFNVTASNGTTFVNAVTFACNGLPDATVSCGFSSIAQGARSPQQVTVTIQTTGPNTSGGVDKFRRRADNRSPWLPLSLPLAGVVMLGFAGRNKVTKLLAIAGLCVSLVAIGLLIACGGGGGGSAPVTVSVSQGTPSSIFPNDTADNWPAQTATFTATVSNTSNTTVTWTASSGTIASTGNDTATYTAPTIAPGLPSSATITATSATGTTGTATETLKPATVPGSYPLTVTATEGSISNKTSTITLTVQ